MTPTTALLVILAAAPGPKKVVLGKLGQATESTAIYASPTARSRVYYRVKPYDYLVVRKTRSSAWVQVLMQTGQYGYASTKAVAQLPYEVTQTPKTTTARATLVSSRSANAVANYSLNFIGTPYVWGGNDPNRGIDCSGFVKQMYGTIGKSLPRTAAEQAHVGQPITRLENLQSGDRLYFWDKKRGKIGHTGIYLGNGYFVHSSSGRGGVATDYLTQRWQNILVSARR